jgi:HEAT repeat protein
MLKGMAEMFVPKFLAYFDRKNLSSFSIKSTITRKEFEAFVDIMSESPNHEESDNSRDRLTLDLIKKSVLNVSTVFNVDLVGKERKLPWRVDIALTRLKRDLSLIPLYKNINEEKIAELKNMVFDDIIRPIKNYKIVKDMLINLDIISPDIAGISREEFEDRITDYIHKDYLLLAAPEILDFLSDLVESYKKMNDKGILERLQFIQQMAKKVGLKIISYGIPDEKLLLEFFNQKILDLDDLPENLHLKVKRREEIGLFLQETQKYFTILENADSPDKIEKISFFLLNFLPELYERNLITESEEILRNIHAKGFNFTGIDSMLLDEIVSVIVKKIDEGTKEEQMRLLDTIDFMDKVAVMVLINFLVHKSRAVRKIACDKLIKLGKAAVPALKGSITKHKDWFHIRNVLMILAEVGQDSPGLEEIFKEYLLHKEPRIRVEAVAGIVSTLGKDAEGELLSTLKDENPFVRKKTIWALGKINSVRTDAISFFINTITGKSNEEDIIIEQVLSSIQTYPHDLEETKRFEEAIIEALSKGTGFFGKLGSTSLLSNRIRERMCETLGYIGGRKSSDFLIKIARKSEPSVKKKAREALDKIKPSIA